MYIPKNIPESYKGSYARVALALQERQAITSTEITEAFRQNGITSKLAPRRLQERILAVQQIAPTSLPPVKIQVIEHKGRLIYAAVDAESKVIDEAKQRVEKAKHADSGSRRSRRSELAKEQEQILNLQRSFERLLTFPKERQLPAHVVEIGHVKFPAMLYTQGHISDFPEFSAIVQVPTGGYVSFNFRIKNLSNAEQTDLNLGENNLPEALQGSISRTCLKGVKADDASPVTLTLTEAGFQAAANFLHRPIVRRVDTHHDDKLAEKLVEKGYKQSPNSLRNYDRIFIPQK